jgi:hypothetical protein
MTSSEETSMLRWKIAALAGVALGIGGLPGVMLSEAKPRIF